MASALAAGARGRTGSSSRGRARVPAEPANRCVRRGARPEAVELRHVRRHQPLEAPAPRDAEDVGRQHGVWPVSRGYARPGGRVPQRARARQAALHGAGAVRAVQAGAADPVVPAMVQDGSSASAGSGRRSSLAGGRFTSTYRGGSATPPACSGRSRFAGQDAPRFPARKARSSRCTVLAFTAAVPPVAAASRAAYQPARADDEAEAVRAPAAPDGT